MLLELSRTRTQDARPMPIAALRQYVEQVESVRHTVCN